MKRGFRRGAALLLCLLLTVSCIAVGGVLRVAAITASDAVAWAKAQGDRRTAFDLDAHYGYQCSDFVTAYMNYLVDGSYDSGRYQVYDAKDYPGIAAAEPERWTVLRGAEMLPQPGDIFVASGREHTFGHAGIILEQVGKKYRVVDQNTNPIDYEKGSPCYTHEVSLINDYALKALIRFHFEPETFTLTYHANGGENAPAAQTGSGTVRLSAEIPARANYDFLGWAQTANATAAQYPPGADFELKNDTTLYAVWKWNQPEPPQENPTARAVLYVPSDTTVEYRAHVTVTARADGVPAGYALIVYENGNARARGDHQSVSCTLGDVKGTRTIEVKVIGPDGAVQKDGSGAELSRTVTIKTSRGLLVRLIAFVKGLFGLLPHVELRP